MEIALNKVSYEGKWHEFAGGKLKIRPFPASKIVFVVRDGATVIGGEQALEKFAYCLEAWEGFVAPAPDLKPIVLTDEVKRKLFDFRLVEAEVDGEQWTLANFVTDRADAMGAEIRSAEKN